MKRLLLYIAFLLCPGFLFGQGAVTTTLQVQNSGSTVFTRSGFIRWNFTSGCTATVSGGALNVACTGGAANPGGLANQIQYSVAGTSFGGFTMSGDCTIVVGTGVITCTKTSGAAFAASATTDATNATNIGSGTLNAARLPATAVLTNQANTFSTGLQNMSAADYLQPVHVSDPATCTAGQIEFNSTSTVMKVCTATNTWTSLGAGGGSGTVTSFSAGTLSPLFTTSVATGTTTPALSFILSNAAANTIFGNFTGGSAAPSFNAIAACGDATHALSWVAGTGFACQAIAPSTSALWLPFASTGELQATTAAQTDTVANQLSCTQFTPPIQISPTKFTVTVQTTSVGQSAQVGIYDSSLNLIRDSGALTCNTGGGTGVTTTVSSFTLTPGTTYYQCTAISDSTCALMGVASNSNMTALANKNATRDFTCANALAAGALPATCGVTTPATQKRYIALLEQ